MTKPVRGQARPCPDCSQCDQARPACSRCARLGIPCIGCGQQRFKFKDETEALRVAKAQPTGPAAAAAAAPTRDKTFPSRPLSSLAARACGAIVSVLQISDPRYDLLAFGPFIDEIPSRLGTHAALDASADALASAFSCVHTKRITPQSLAKYARALRSVQDSLQSPGTAYSEQTLCAIYFIMLCQVRPRVPTSLPHRLIRLGAGVDRQRRPAVSRTRPGNGALTQRHRLQKLAHFLEQRHSGYDKCLWYEARCTPISHLNSVFPSRFLHGCSDRG